MRIQHCQGACSMYINIDITSLSCLQNAVSSKHMRLSTSGRPCDCTHLDRNTDPNLHSWRTNTQKMHPFINACLSLQVLEGRAARNAEAAAPSSGSLEADAPKSTAALPQ